MSNPPPIEELTIARLHAAYLSGDVTSATITRAYLDRIEAYDRRGPYLNSLISLNAVALHEADRLDAALRAGGTLTGPLHGVPVIVKDNLDTVDMPTTSGLRILKDFVPERDAFIVRRLRNAGAILLAKASLSELAMGLPDNINSVLPGFTRNPYNLAYASGGSSGGTGVAIAANFGTIGLGTDTGGSVRAPASINNLVGVRPTVGLVSRTGMAPLDSRRDTPGPMTRSVEDAADPCVMGLFESAVADLLAAGADLVDDFRVPGFEHFPRPPQTAATTRADWERFFAYQGPAFPIKSVADLRDAPPGKRVHPLHAARIAEIAAVTLAPEEDPETIEGRKTEQAYRDAFTAAMDLARVDALVLPVWTYPPVLLGDRGQSPQGGMTFIASALQWPVVAVPIGFVGEHLPIGMQFLARPWAEGPLLRLAYAYEQHSPHRRPPLTTPPLAGPHRLQM